MKINFQHNTLIRETITEGFLRYFNENLLPVLKEKYADEGTEVLFYENTLNLDLTKDGKRYYPLTVIAQGTPVRQWVSWEFPKGNAFLDMNPFAGGVLQIDGEYSSRLSTRGNLCFCLCNDGIGPTSCRKVFAILP